ncbi:MAG: hypothetical protein GZ086_09140 [Gelidibacter sp.]|nr:hypothetical protein [Gelidibacter sp.]
MSRSKKIISIFLIIVVGFFFFLQYKFKSSVINAIDTKLPSNIELKYAQINANVFSGNVELDSFSAKLLNSDSNVISTLNANKLKVSGFSLWQFIFNKTISIDDIIFDNPNLQYDQKQQEQHRPKDSTANKQFEKTITIDKFSIVNGSFKVNGNKEVSILMRMDSINLTLNGISTNAEKLKQKIPFNYKDFQMKSKQFFLNLSNYEELKIEALAIENEKINLKNLFITSKFTKEELSKKIVVERDHFDLHIPELAMNKLNFGFNNNKFYVIVDSSKIIKPNLIVYRDKRVADDKSIKKMYSKILRDLSFDLAISTLKIKQGSINYKERVEDTNEAGEIFFNNVNATLNNLSNTYKEGGKTKVTVSSNFMGKAPMNLNISFDVNNKQDQFLASGQFKNFNAKIVNTFFESNLNAKAEGEIEQIFFTFNGNNFNSNGDLKMKYNEFKFEILNKKNRVNKFLTAIGNIFVNDGSKADKDGYRHGEIKVERNKNKSFFNYLWINVEDGLRSTLTGKGEKE